MSSARNNRACVLAFVLLLVAFLAACSHEAEPSNEAPVASSPPQTAFPLPPTKGTSLSNLGWSLSDGTHRIFSDYKGKVLVLDFYATWCGPCRNSIPHLIELQKKYQTRGVAVVGLNVGGPGDLDKVPDFAREFGIQYPLGEPDVELVTFLLSDSDAIPQTFVFDRQGQLVERFLGFGPMTGGRIDLAVESALPQAP